MPNVLLVVFDTARADAFEPHGGPPGSTPAAAQLAAGANGVAHDAMYSTACWTVPAHGSLFTGRLPRAAGFAHEGGGTPALFKGAMDAVGDAVLPAVLRRHGYDTAGVSANPWISAATGFDRGFDRFQLFTTDRNPKLAAERRRDRAAWLLDAVRARADDGAAAIEALLAEWARDRRRRPFFWFVNLMECHSLYLPPKPHSPFGPLGRLRSARDASRHCTLDAIWRVAAGGWDIDDRALARMRANYWAAIRQLDAWLARVLDRLDAAGILEETLVVVTSDHGENLGEGRRFGHAFSLDDRLLRVPFLASGPTALDLPAVASLADVPRHLTTALGIEAPEFAETRAADVAVAQFDAEGTHGDPKVDEVLERWGLGEEARLILCTSFSCATDGALKLVRQPAGEELFDLADDPLELRPRPIDASIEETYGPRLEPLRRALDSAAREERSKASVAAPPAADADADADEVAALEEQMRLLGYL